MAKRGRIPAPFTPDRAVAAAQRAVGDAVQRFENSAIVGGRQIDGIELAGSSSKTVRHGLKRQAKGAWAVRCEGGPSFLEIGPLTAETVRVENHFGSAVTISLWVY